MSCESHDNWDHIVQENATLKAENARLTEDRDSLKAVLDNVSLAGSILRESQEDTEHTEAKLKQAQADRDALKAKWADEWAVRKVAEAQLQQAVAAIQAALDTNGGIVTGESEPTEEYVLVSREAFEGLSAMLAALEGEPT